NTAAAAAVAFTVAVAIGLFVSQQLTDPIAELQRATSRLANEDYSAALPDVRTRDELEDVAVDFATMVRRLRSTMERLASQVAESEQQRARLAAILQSIDEAILLV